jgi:hypothetical protein
LFWFVVVAVVEILVVEVVDFDAFVGFRVAVVEEGEVVAAAVVVTRETI